MHRTLMTALSLGALSLALGCASTQTADAPPADSPAGVGDTAPNPAVVEPSGSSVTLREIQGDVGGPLVVTFYRGNWCPYCNTGLTDLQKRAGEFRDAGATLVAVSPETLPAVRRTVESNRLSYIVVSDADGSAARSFGVEFELDDSTQTRYKGYGIDLASHNASGEWSLPHPATYVIDTEGTIRFAYTDTDYSKRVDPDDVLAAVRALN